ncbi:hypothetical protein GCM10010365_71750 [Streptomyces poonensis]|uniref:Uncharacterized protein n=1 Tax=Streptomyces poonensis TaxID=68255 RepID=A0A918UXU5_9ACTN|nr:hypothetical protein GCM10010365_71750 [Streptomyces poonensis]GLJ93052.1 hypothetical protein GCM10017589_56640 [Streptomyces poonensis]
MAKLSYLAKWECMTAHLARQTWSATPSGTAAINFWASATEKESARPTLVARLPTNGCTLTLYRLTPQGPYLIAGAGRSTG